MDRNANAARARDGERDISKLWQASNIALFPPKSTADFAALKVSRQFGLPLYVSRVVCELSGLGGRP